MTLPQHALRLALADARAYRACVLAALDQLHTAQQTIERQQEQIREMREEIRRYGERVFHE